jgi:hypothetical protein
MRFPDAYGVEEPTYLPDCSNSVKSAIGWALLATSFVLACTPQGLECGEPAALEPHPQNAAFKGAPLGPLLVRNFRDDATTAVITEYQQGYPLKVLIVVARPFTKPLTMRCFRCSDGSALRFAATYPFAFNSTPAPSDVYNAAGEAAPVLEPMTALPAGVPSAPSAYPYMLFTSSGKWVLEVRDSTGLVGRTVLLVR